MNNVNVAASKQKLAEILKRKKKQDEVRVEIIKQASSKERRLSFAQRRLWFLSRYEKDNSIGYNIPCALELTGELDVEALEASINLIVARHDIMRSCYVEERGEPCVKTVEEYKVKLNVKEILESDIESIATEHAHYHFDLSCAPLFKISLYRVSSDKHVFLLNMHHIITDAWSIKVFTQELAENYTSIVSVDTIDESDTGQVKIGRPGNSIQYSDYSRWQIDRLDGGKLNHQIEFWRKEMSRVPKVLELPTDYPRPEVQSYTGAANSFYVSETLRTKVIDFCEEQGVTHFMFFLSAFKLFLWQYSGQKDIVVGTPVANRSHSQLEDLIGLFVNSIVIRTQIEDGKSYLSFLDLVKQKALASYQNQDLPFEKIVELAGVVRDLKYSPVYQVMFNMLDDDQGITGLDHFPGVAADTLVYQQNISVRTDLDFSVVSKKGTWEVIFLYNTALFSDVTITNMKRRFEVLVNVILEHPNISLKKIDCNIEPNLVYEPAMIGLGGKEKASYHQERIWFIDQFEKGTVYTDSPVYHNVPLAVLFEGDVDACKLEEAINQLIDSNPILRSRFVKDSDNLPVPIIASEIKVPFEIKSCSENEINDEFSLIQRTLREPFDLSEGPLIRSYLFSSTYKKLLVISIHHIVVDAASIDDLFHQLCVFYGANSDAVDLIKNNGVADYYNYSRWQHDRQTIELEPHLFYWRKQLKAPIQPLTLPENYSRAAIHRFDAGRLEFSFDSDLATKLKQFCDIEQIDPATATVSAFKILLHRYANINEIVIGSSRSISQITLDKGLVGPYSNLVVLRSWINSNDTFFQSIQNMDSLLNEVNKYRDIPFDYLAQVINPKKDMSRTVFFDVVFNYKDKNVKELNLPGCKVSRIETQLGFGKYDISFNITKTNGTWNGEVIYNKELYCVEFMEQFLAHYSELLTYLISSPTARIGAVELSPNEKILEKNKLLESNGIVSKGIEDRSLVDILSSITDRFSEKVAVSSNGIELSYSDLDELSTYIAQSLIAKGISPKQGVAIRLQHSCDTILAIYAILKAGCYYVPIPFDAPKERYEFVLNDSGATLLITESQESVEACNGDLLVCCIDELMTFSRNLSASYIKLPKISPADHCYCIYTSGSTGTPKGVRVQHKNVVSLLGAGQDLFKIDDQDTWVLFHSYAFDFSVWEIFGALGFGCKLLVATEDQRRDPRELIALIETEKVTILNQTPLAFYSFANETVKDASIKLSSLRLIIFGGEALVPAKLTEWRGKFPHTKLINMYGITETTVHVTHRLLSSVDLATSMSNIGEPIPGWEIFILDEDLNRVPALVAGEIYVGGKGLASHYQGRAYFTAERFVPHPWSSDPGARLYRSGDSGRYLLDGSIEYIGRLDNQIKIRGFRVELGEIEQAICSQPGIADVAVCVYERGNNNDKYLVAYLVKEKVDSTDVKIDKTSLKTALRSLLPSYMEPTLFIELDALPITTNGKLDRKALIEPNLKAAPDVDDRPIGKVEIEMAEIWAEILCLSPSSINRTDSFFEVGGHSLLATQLVSRIRDHWGVLIKIKTIFENPVLSEFCSFLNSNLKESVQTVEDDLKSIGSANTSNKLIPIRGDSSSLVPASFAQQRLWFIHEYEGEDSITYNMPWALRLDGNIDYLALEKAILGLFERHGCLRTSFRMVDGKLFQHISESVAIKLVPLDVKEQDIDEIIKSHAGHHFDLCNVPLIKIDLYRVKDDEHYFLINLHHIISDGWSMGILVSDLSVLYSQQLDCSMNQLPIIPIDYADYSVWQRSQAESQSYLFSREIDYWKEQLNGAPEILSLPIDYPRPLNKQNKGAAVRFRVEKTKIVRIKELSDAHDVTLFMTLLGAFYVMLWRRTNQTDIVVGTPVAGRQSSELENIIGLFVNSIPLRLNFKTDVKFSNLLESVKEIALQAYDYQSVPFEALVEAINPIRNKSYSPIFQVMFVLQNMKMEKFDFPGINVTSVDGDSTTSKFDLTLNLWEDEHGLDCWLEYDVSIFNAKTIQAFADHYLALLNSITDSFELPVRDMPALSCKDYQYLLKDLNQTEKVFPHDTSLVALFEYQVSLNPDELAIIFQDVSFSYRELNERINRLSHYLSKNGVASGRPVGICLERSEAAIITIFAILKVGAYYVPMDRSLPKSRFHTMVQNVGLDTVVVDSGLENRAEFFKDLGKTVSSICLDAIESRLSKYSTKNPKIYINANSIAYVIHTLGSTGGPKGVAVTHKNVSRLVFGDFIDFEEGDRFLCAAPLSFDASIFEIFYPLIRGGVTVVAPDRVLTADAIECYVNQLSIDTMWLSSALFNSIVDDNVEVFKHVKQLLVGGGALSIEQIRKVKQKHPNISLINEYGATENTTFTCTFQIPELFNFASATNIPIGGPVDNTNIYILDNEFEPVPRGAIGELYIGGHGLSLGYLGDARLTADRFLPNPFSSEYGGRLYKSGDLVRLNYRNEVEYLGRVDSQIKLGGFRIELDEIKHHIEKNSGILSATVQLVENQNTGNCIVAYYVENESSEGVDKEELKNELRLILPDYMVPSAFVLLNELPISLNGKIDPLKLPTPSESDYIKTNNSVPAKGIEVELAKIWAELLCMNSDLIGREENFFSVGGHSLLIVEMRSQIEKVWDVSIPIKSLFNTIILKDLANLVEQSITEKRVWCKNNEIVEDEVVI